AFAVRTAARVVVSTAAGRGASRRGGRSADRRARLPGLYPDGDTARSLRPLRLSRQMASSWKCTGVWDHSRQLSPAHGACACRHDDGAAAGTDRAAARGTRTQRRRLDCAAVGAVPGTGGVLTMYFLVKRAHGPSWDPSRPRREQDGWDAHAEFMDRLVEEGFVVLGGPVGEGDGDYALQVVEAESEAAVR